MAMAAEPTAATAPSVSASMGRDVTFTPMTDEGPSDPFADVPGPWGKSFATGDTLFKALADLPDVVKVLVAVKTMPREELECVVLERVASWHVARGGMFAVDPWLFPEEPPAPPDSN